MVRHQIKGGSKGVNSTTARFFFWNISLPGLLILAVSIPSAFSQTTTYVMSPGTVTLSCVGTEIFVDQGGSGGDASCCDPYLSSCSTLDYYDDMNMEETFCTSNGNCILINFLLAANLYICSGDTLFFYNGPNSSSPPLTWGSTVNFGKDGYITNYSAAVTSITSTSPCVTFKFVSNSSVHGKGWRMQLSCTPCTFPSNDNYTNAQPLTVGSSCTYTTGTTYHAQSSNTCSTAPTCSGAVLGGGNPDDDVWFTFTTGPTQTTATVSIASASGMDPVVQVFSGTCGSFTQLTNGCVNSSTGATETTTALTVSPSTTYYVRVYDYASNGSTNNTTNSFQICVTGATSHDCSGQSELCNTSSFTGSLTGGFGTQEYNSNGSWGCIFGEHNTLWYTFKANATGPLDFNIASNPTSSFQDVDWALWGPFNPNPSCNLTASNILASSYAVSNANPGCSLPGYSTGISYCETGGTYCEGAGGNGNIVAFVKELNVTSGNYYVLLIDLFAGNSNFTFNWGTTSTGGQTSIANCLLPIEVIYFDGEALDGMNHLHWSTGAEENNNYFAVERSRDGEAFDSIGTVEGAGTSITQSNYQFIDANPMVGRNYYRVRQVDHDGNYTYTHIILLENSVVGFAIDAVYPNPTNGLTNVDIMGNEGSIIEWQVVDAMGRLLIHDRTSIHQGKNTFSFDLSGFANGLYYLACSNSANNVKLFEKVVKN